MPAYKETNGTWTAYFRYKNWLGEPKQKRKRGFVRKKDADAFETEFKALYIRSAAIPFSGLVTKYLDDLITNDKIEVTTAARKKDMFEKKLIPFFRDKAINQITELDILNWQTWIQQQGYAKYKERGYSQTYLKTIHNEMSTIMNYACRYYKLTSNPCYRAGSMGKSNADAMEI